MKKTIIFLILTIVVSASASPDETCCPTRDLAMRPISMPPGQEQGLSNFYQGAVLYPLIWDAIESTDSACPEISYYDLEAKAAADDLARKIDQAVRKEKGWPPNTAGWKPSPPDDDMDYVFVGDLTADQVTGKNRSGNLEGKFTFHLRLLDHHHDQVLKDGSTSWAGGIMDGANLVETLTKSFTPVPRLLEDYERIPEKARVDVPNDEVQAGQITYIKLSELFDKDGRPTQWWQRLFVHVEKGAFLNAEQKVEKFGKLYYVFRAGNGTVNMKYQAPNAITLTSAILPHLSIVPATRRTSLWPLLPSHPR